VGAADLLRAPGPEPG